MLFVCFAEFGCRWSVLCPELELELSLESCHIHLYRFVLCKLLLGCLLACVHFLLSDGFVLFGLLLVSCALPVSKFVFGSLALVTSNSFEIKWLQTYREQISMLNE